MKKLLILCVLATTALTAMQCCKTDPKPIDPIDLLPPATQTGENTFGCLVNGEAFVVTNSSKMSAIYQGGFLQFGAGDRENDLEQGITIVLSNPIDMNTIYDLTELPFREVEYNSLISGVLCEYSFESTYEGGGLFSNIDYSNFIISGTFEFSTVTQTCDTVRITNGRFDMQYIP